MDFSRTIKMHGQLERSIIPQVRVFPVFTTFLCPTNIRFDLYPSGIPSPGVEQIPPMISFLFLYYYMYVEVGLFVERGALKKSRNLKKKGTQCEKLQNVSEIFSS